MLRQVLLLIGAAVVTVMCLYVFFCHVCWLTRKKVSVKSFPELRCDWSERHFGCTKLNLQ